MLRAMVTGGFLVLALIILSISFVFSVEPSTESLLVNLGTEIIGIVITVAVVEWFFERRRLQNRGRQLTWDALHAVEHAVWVWQGGPRERDTDEVLGVLDAVGDNDRIPDFTEGLFRPDTPVLADVLVFVIAIVIVKMKPTGLLSIGRN